MPSVPSRPAWQAAVLRDWNTRRAWVLAQQVAITQIAAPTGFEASRARSMFARLGDAGPAAPCVDDAGNVVVHIAPEGASDPESTHAVSSAAIVCLAHLDTVFAPDALLDAEYAGSCIRCPGIGDNGRGLAALLALAHTLQLPAVRARLQRPVELVATVGEEGEGNLRGARAYFDEREARGHHTAAAIAVDGPGDRTVVHHAVGSQRVRLHFLGAGGHSWVNAGTPNPVNAAGALITSLNTLAQRERPHAVVTVSRMRGGETLTSIPRDAWIDVDVRAYDATRLARICTVIHRLAERAAADESRLAPGLALRVRSESLGARPAGHLDDAHPLVQLAAHITERAGRAPQSASASTDANVPLARGIAAIAIGAGGTGGDAHTLTEWFDDAESEVGLVRLLDLVTTLACSRTPVTA